MQLTQFEYNFLRSIEKRALEEVESLKYLSEAVFRPKFEQTSDEKKFNGYQRVFILNQILYLSGRIFFLSRSAFDKKDPKELEDDFINFLKESSQLIM